MCVFLGVNGLQFGLLLRCEVELEFGNHGGFASRTLSFGFGRGLLELRSIPLAITLVHCVLLILEQELQVLFCAALRLWLVNGLVKNDGLRLALGSGLRGGRRSGWGWKGLGRRRCCAWLLRLGHEIGEGRL